MTLQEENNNVDRIANAILRSERYGSVKAKFTMTDGKVVKIERSFPLPSPQMTGTMTQRRTYATMKAQEIVKTAITGGL